MFGKYPGSPSRNVSVFRPLLFGERLPQAKRNNAEIASLWGRESDKQGMNNPLRSWWKPRCLLSVNRHPSQVTCSPFERNTARTHQTGQTQNLFKGLNIDLKPKKRVSFKPPPSMENLDGRTAHHRGINMMRGKKIGGKGDEGGERNSGLLGGMGHATICEKG